MSRGRQILGELSLRPVGPVTQSYLTLYAITAVNLIGGVLAARLLRVEGRGRLALLSQAAQTSASILEFGLGVGLVLWLGRRPTKLGQATRTFLEITAVLTVPAGVLTVGLLLLSRDKLTGVEVGLAVVLSGCALVSKPALGLLRANHDFHAVNRSLLIVPIVYVTLMSVTALVASSVAAPTVLALSIFAISVGGFIAIVNLPSPRFHAPRLRVAEVKEIFKSGIRSQVGVLSPMDYMQLDVLILALSLPAAEVGKYAVLASIAGLIRGQSYAAGSVLLAKFSRLEGRLDTALTAIKLPVVLALSSVPVVAAGAWFGIPILYGNDFLVTFPIILLVLAAAGLGASKQLFYDVLRVHDRRATPTILEVCLALTFLGVMVGAKPQGLLLPACSLFALQFGAALGAAGRTRVLVGREGKI